MRTENDDTLSKIMQFSTNYTECVTHRWKVNSRTLRSTCEQINCSPTRYHVRLWSLKRHPIY